MTRKVSGDRVISLEGEATGINYADLVEAKRVHPVIVIDEAQALRQHVLEEIRILMNFRMDSVDLATLLFVGQESIGRRLSLGVLDPLASRIVMRAHLGGLGREEIDPYLEHRLARAGVTRPIYSEPAIEAMAHRPRPR